MDSNKIGEIKPSYQVIVNLRHEGQRIDNFLSGRLKGVPKVRIYRILRRGEVRVNKGRVRQDYRLQMGDVVRIPPVRYKVVNMVARPEEWILQVIDESILYEDHALLVLNKPSGIAVHGGSGRSYGVIEALRVLRPQAPLLELVHRLDRETSGCLMIAKKRGLLKHLHRSLHDRQIDKRYLALVRGGWRGGMRRVDAALRKNVLRSGERVVQPDSAGKPAITLLRPVAVNRFASLLEARTVTGRTHQIRVHAALQGHPIAGDLKYGDKAFNQILRESGLRRLFLHAHAIVYREPDTHRELRVVAPLGAELQSVLKRIGLSYDDIGISEEEVRKTLTRVKT